MKGKELIEIIKQDNLEEYEILIMTDFIEENDKGYITYQNIEISDIGVSDKKIILRGDRF